MRMGWVGLTGVLLGVILFGDPAGRLSEGEPKKPWKGSDKVRVAEWFNRAYADRDWERAIKYALKLIELEPGEPVVEYNLACVYALNGEVENASDWLVQSAKHGFHQLELFESDEDLAALHGKEAYRKAHELVRKNYARRMEKLRRTVDECEPVILFPKGEDPKKPLPVVVALHPYGGTPEGIAKCWEEAAQSLGVILVAPRAIHPVGASGTYWGAVEDAYMLVVRALKKVRQNYTVDEDAVVLSGFSQGASIAFRLGMRYPEEFCGVLPVAGHFTVLGFSEDERGDTAVRPRFFIMVGGEDKKALASNELALQELREAGVEVKMKIYPGLGHSFPHDQARELREAFAFLRGDESLQVSSGTGRD